MSAGGEAKLIQLSGIQMLGDTFFSPPQQLFSFLVLHRKIP